MLSLRLWAPGRHLQTSHFHVPILQQKWSYRVVLLLTHARPTPGLRRGIQHRLWRRRRIPHREHHPTSNSTRTKKAPVNQISDGFYYFYSDDFIQWIAKYLEQSSVPHPPDFHFPTAEADVQSHKLSRFFYISQHYYRMLQITLSCFGLRSHTITACNEVQLFSHVQFHEYFQVTLHVHVRCMSIFSYLPPGECSVLSLYSISTDVCRNAETLWFNKITNTTHCISYTGTFGSSLDVFHLTISLQHGAHSKHCVAKRRSLPIHVHVHLMHVYLHFMFNMLTVKCKYLHLFHDV